MIDKRGFVLGIASGQNNDKGYYSHIDEIYRFLKDNKQSGLVEAPKD